MNFYYFSLWVCGFFVTFIGGLFFLRLAKSERRLESTALALRAIAVLVAGLLVYAASFDGINVGAIIAFLAILGIVVFRKPE